MNINPIFSKEMKRQSRGSRLSFIVFFSNILFSVIVLVSYFYEPANQGYVASESFDVPVRSYMILGYVLLVIISIISLVLGGASISLENEQRTLDTMLMTAMTPRRIIFGKMQTTLGIILLLLIASIPSMTLVMVIGGISLFDLVMLDVSLLFTAFFVSSIGIFCSAVFKKTVVSIIATFMILMVFIIGTAIIVVMGANLANVGIDDPNVVHDATASGGGFYIYVLLLNPLTTHVGILGSQVGTGKELLLICNQFGDYSGNFVVNHMLYFALGLQTLIAVCLLNLASKFIDPLRE